MSLPQVVLAAIQAAISLVLLGAGAAKLADLGGFAATLASSVYRNGGPAVPPGV